MAAEIAPWFGGAAMDQPVTVDNGIRAETSHGGARRAQAGVRPALRLGHRRATRPPSPTAPRRCCSWPRRRRGAGLRAARLPPELRGRGGGSRAGSSSWGRCTRCPRRWSAPVSPGATSAWSRSTRPSPPRCLSNVQAWGSAAWAERLGLCRPGRRGGLGHHQRDGGVDRHRPPVRGHRCRLVTTLANEMRRRDVQFGLISICAQGGMGYALVLERDG